MFSYCAGSPGTFAGPRQHDMVGPGYGVTTATTVDQATGLPVTTTSQDWTDVLAQTMRSSAELYALNLQQRALVEQRHQIARDNAAAREAQLNLARVATNQAVLSANMPRGAAPGGGGGVSPMLLIGGLAVVGAAVFFLMPKRRR